MAACGWVGDGGGDAVASTQVAGAGPGDPVVLVGHQRLEVSDLDAVVDRITYRSTDDAERRSTGLLLRPRGEAPRDGWPVVTWGHPSVGIADRCAPSTDPAEAAGTVVRALVGRGYAVVISDDEGLGTPGRHPYLVAPSEAWSVLAAVPAAAAVPGAHLGADVVAWGHSQGGHAVLAASEQQVGLLGDRRLVGVVAEAPVTDVAGFAAYTSFADAHAVAALVVAGYAAAHPDLDPAAVLTGAAVDLLPVVDHACLATLGNELEGVDDDQFRSGPLTADPQWADALEEGVVGRHRAQSPVLVLHGTGDPIVPVDQSRRYHREACAAGSQVELQEVVGADHGTVIDRSLPTALAWVDARVRDEPAASGCPSSRVGQDG